MANSQISIIYGRLGQGKTFYATRLIYLWWQKGRRQYSTYPTPWARPLATLAHAWCRPFRGSDFTFDESAASFNARDFKDLDALSFGALTHARHQDVRVRFIAQDPVMLDANFRRLADEFIRVHRVGPAGDSAVGQPKPGLFRRPWWFCATYFGREAFDDNFVLKTTARPRRRVRFRFSRLIADGYDTHNHIVPPQLDAAVKRLEDRSAMMAELPYYQFLNGKPLETNVPPVNMWWPMPPGAESKYRELDEDKASAARASLLRQLHLTDGDGVASSVFDVPAQGKLERLSGPIMWIGPALGFVGVLEVNLDGQSVLLPESLFTDNDPDFYRGWTLSLAVRTFRESGQDVCVVDTTAQRVVLEPPKVKRLSNAN